MAKRVKIKGKPPRIKNRPPRGLSKAERVMSNAEDENYSRGGDPGIFGGQLTSRELIKEMRLGRGATRPSSTRKKRVKEGNRKFIGPRQLKSEIGEDVKARSRDLDYIRGKSPMDVVDYMLGKTRYRQPKKLRAPARRRLYLDDYNPTAEEHSYGIGGIAKSKRLRQLLERLMDRHFGGGQEFDPQD